MFELRRGVSNAIMRRRACNTAEMTRPILRAGSDAADIAKRRLADVVVAGERLAAQEDIARETRERMRQLTHPGASSRKALRSCKRPQAWTPAEIRRAVIGAEDADAKARAKKGRQGQARSEAQTAPRQLGCV